MKLSRKSFLAIVIVSATAQLLAAQTPEIDSRNAKADSLTAALAHSGGAGCAVRVVRNGASVYSRNFGLADIEHGIPISDSTIFDIGSVSKQFTAAVILQLGNEGKLSMDDPARKYVPELPAYAAPVKIRHLLHHMSGVRDYIDLLPLAGMQFESVVGPADALAMLARQKSLNFVPGTEFAYSNSNYFLLSQVAERVSKKSMRQLLDERIFKPLALSSAVLWTDHNQIVHNRAASYGPGNSEPLAHVSYNWETTGDGAIQMTASDLARWGEALERRDAALGKDVIEQMEKSGVLNDGTRTTYGSGMFSTSYRGLPFIWHNGSASGFRADLSRFPAQHVVLATLCNLGTTTPWGLDRQLANIFLADEIKAAASVAANSPGFSPARAASGASPSLSAARRAQLAGHYFSDATGLLHTIVDSADALKLNGAGPPRPLRLIGNEQFDATGGLTITITGTGPSMRIDERNAAGIVTRYSRVADATTMTAARAREYEGDYFSGELGTTWHLRADGNRLMLRTNELLASSDSLTSDFKDGFGSPIASLRFVRDATGKVTGTRVWMRGVRGLLLTRQH